MTSCDISYQPITTSIPSSIRSLYQLTLSIYTINLLTLSLPSPTLSTQLNSLTHSITHPLSSPSLQYPEEGSAEFDRAMADTTNDNVEVGRWSERASESNAWPTRQILPLTSPLIYYLTHLTSRHCNTPF